MMASSDQEFIGFTRKLEFDLLMEVFELFSIRLTLRGELFSSNIIEI